MTKEYLDKRVGESLEGALKMLNDKGSYIPQLEIEFTDDKGGKNLVVCVLAIDDTHSKQRRMFIGGLGTVFGGISQLGKIKEVNSIVMTNEAWFSTPSKLEVEKYGARKPSEDPNKREMFLCAGLTPNGISSFKAKEMFRVEVKGKNYFTLSDIPEMEKDPTSLELNILQEFYDGFQHAVKRTPEFFKMTGMSTDRFKDTPLGEMLKTGVETLQKQLQGVESKFIEN